MIETGRPITEIAREFELNEGTLGNWVNEWRQSNPEPEKALTPVERPAWLRWKTRSAGCGWRTSF